MNRSMFAAISGLRGHQTMMDVVGNNIANVNTMGFKASRVQFSDALSQLLRGATGGTGEATGGVNPQQVGLGTQILSTELIFSQGGSQLTGIATDVAIQGDGFLVSRDQSGESLYTRMGALHFDQNGFLVDPTGGIVQGWVIDQTGVVNPNSPVGDVKIPVGQSVQPVATSSVTMRGNLSADAAVGDPPIVTAIDVVDSIGAKHRITLEFEKTDENEWEMTVRDPAGNALGTATTITFDPDTGRIDTPTTAPTVNFAPAGAAAMTFEIDFGSGGTTAAGLTQFGSPSDAQAVSQDGKQAGFLRSFAIGVDGTVTGVFSNGSSQPLAKLALATFANPKALLSAGDSQFRRSNGSGLAVIGEPGIGGRGTLQAGALEMSNVDLSAEFTNMILAQRGFQANSRVITTSDEMIQELVNLRR